MTSHAEARVQARIAAARRQIEERKRRRAELAEARRYGLKARKTAKLRRRQQA
ncbi:hypothetical protein [Streptomyces sp. NRRL S-118]|uniref:hypothetical protein n=1 Tax=Streptomyces sp. NRRL S-118 TaxID=1463881 RepID=UPI000B132CD5|nr:hypothetical protein [Streptomyces sp. NRRL S-118]